MIVERLSPSDLEACERIARASFSPPQFDLAEESRRDIALLWIARSRATDEASAFLLAWGVADELHVLTVATAPEARRRGFGGALVDAALAHARTHRARLVLLEVRADNVAARALYERAGFRVETTRRGYYADGGDALEMMLFLEETAASPG